MTSHLNSINKSIYLLDKMISFVLFVHLAPPRPGDGICARATWAQHGQTVVGGNGQGFGLNQLNSPFGLFVDDKQAIYVVDFGNHRIVKWDRGVSSGQLVAGGNGEGDHDDQLMY